MYSLLNWVGRESDITVNREVIFVISGQLICTDSIPFEIPSELSRGSKIHIRIILPKMFVPCQEEFLFKCIIPQNLITDTCIEFGYYRLFCPRLQPYIESVVETRKFEYVRTCCGVYEKVVVV